MTTVTRNSGNEKKCQRLLVTASTFPRWNGDTEPRFILDLSKALGKYYDVTVLAPACPDARDKEVIEGIKVLRYHYFPVRRWETLCYPGAIVPRIKERKIRIILVPFLFLGLWSKLFEIRKQFDIVHAHWIIPQGIVQSFFNTPYVVTGHGGDVAELNFFPVDILKKRALKKAIAISVVSEKQKRILKEKYCIDNVIIQSMGCDIDKFNPLKRVDNYFDTNSKIVLFVGRLVPIKGIEYLIDAMRDVDAKLVIVGKGPLEKQMKSYATKFEEKIIFLGDMSHSELPQVYASSDIFVIPSITLENGVTEGMPTVITEAMASGLPVIGTRTGGIQNAIVDFENGFLVAEKDSQVISERINLLLKDENLKNKMSVHARKSAEMYDYNKIAEEFAKILKGKN